MNKANERIKDCEKYIEFCSDKNCKTCIKCFKEIGDITLGVKAEQERILKLVEKEDCKDLNCKHFSCMTSRQIKLRIKQGDDDGT